MEASRFECVYLLTQLYGVRDMYNLLHYTYLYHHIVVLDKYTHSNLVYYKHNGADEPFGGSFSSALCDLFRPEVGSSMFLRNAGKLLRDYIKLHLKRHSQLPL